ncbi:MAG: hypothetical protein J5935_01930 [Lachnospiraceae bacterium]|nr:hypothetical protein [Lachnospiraceae bacterium]
MRAEKKTIGKFIGFVAAVLLLALLGIAAVFTYVVCVPKDVFSPTYQSVIQDKYAALQRTEGPRLILLGGSSMAYGIDEAYLEELTGLPVVNMGLYGGLGDLFQSQLVRSDLHEGDIVLLGYEYNWIDAPSFSKLLVDTVMSGIDHHIDMYRVIPFRNLPEVIGYLPSYYAEKKEYAKHPGEDVHHTLFDADGRLLQARPASRITDYANQPEVHNPVSLEGAVLSPESIRYLKDFHAFAQKKKAQLFFTAPPFLAEAVEGDAAAFDLLPQLEEEQIGIPYISTPSDYLFPAEWMYDTVYHCNDEGAQIRTERLAEDLMNALNQ